MITLALLGLQLLSRHKFERYSLFALHGRALGTLAVSRLGTHRGAWLVGLELTRPRLRVARPGRIVGCFSRLNMFLDVHESRHKQTSAFIVGHLLWDLHELVDEFLSKL